METPLDISRLLVLRKQFGWAINLEINHFDGIRQPIAKTVNNLKH